MIRIIDLCYRKDSLSRYEFVEPIARIVQNSGFEYEISHFSEMDEDAILQADRTILCGTALKDSYYTRNIAEFSWLLHDARPILGICAGMQVLALVSGGSLQECREIGMTGIRKVRNDPLIADKDAFEAYELHRSVVTCPETFRVLAVSSAAIQIIRHSKRPHYGVMFHPEVRNEWVVERFLNLP
jgi:GMP synthase-like glutamine amidotransferase